MVLVLEDNHKAFWRKIDSRLDTEIEELYRVAISRARSALAIVAFEDARNEAAEPLKQFLQLRLVSQDTLRGPHVAQDGGVV